jgi:hypothetical protein
VARLVVQVDELVVLANPAVCGARDSECGAGGSRERQLAVVEEVLALVGIDELIVHGHAAAALGVRGGRLAGDEVVPGVVGDVMGTARSVNLQEVDAAAGVSDLDTDFVAVNGARPVGNAVGVDLASEDTHGGRVLLMGSDADTLASTASNLLKRAGRDGGGRGNEESSNGGKHFDGCVWCLDKEGIYQRRSVL